MREPHFNGKTFFNPGGPQAHGFRAVLRWMLTRTRPQWRYVATLPAPAPAREVGNGELLATLVGHSTVLLQFDGFNVLTDPIWSERAGPLSFAGPRRFRAPAIRLDDLPRIDVVLISHNHYDHLDVSTLRRIARAHSPAAVVPLKVTPWLHRAGFTRISELDWWQRASVAERNGRKLEVTAVPAQHFSARSPFDRNRTLWAGYVIHAPGGNILFMGDSAFGQHVHEIAMEFASPRLALLPIGAYLPQWFMSPVHMSPVEALQVHRILRPKLSIAIHHDTFELADESQGQAVAELQCAARGAPDELNFIAPEPGTAISVPGADG
jgi:L-ascorbate metabolism protein UlaG (beta-lactamase superfamily)